MRLLYSQIWLTNLSDLYLLLSIWMIVYVSFDGNVLVLSSHKKRCLPLYNNRWFILLIVISGFLPVNTVFGIFMFRKSDIRCFSFLHRLEKDGFLLEFPLFLLLMEQSLIHYYAAVYVKFRSWLVIDKEECFAYNFTMVRRPLRYGLVSPTKRQSHNGGVMFVRFKEAKRTRHLRNTWFKRRLPSLARTTFLCKFMEPAVTTTSSFGGSSRLAALAQQLRLYKPPPSSSFDDAEEMQADQESAGKVVSQVGFQESMAPVPKDPERFRPKRAAVLICIFEGDDGDLRVILTKRSSRLSTHSGEVSLPGGKAEEDDKDDGMTATREAEEEIGLDPSLVEVVTSLEPFLSKHLLRVIPVIGILKDKKRFNPTPNPAEVEAVFDAPLEMFLKDENRTSEEREWMGEKYLIHYFDYRTGDKEYMIWGLTAGILIRAASVTYQRPPAFIEQCPKFKYPKMVEKHTCMP